jgi:FtsZ-binding cell division protein ZapB
MIVSGIPHQEDEAVAVLKRQEETQEVAVHTAPTRPNYPYPQSEDHSEHTAPRRKNDEERFSIFWRLFGGAMISVAALVGVTLYNSMQMSITELRSEVTRLNEAKSDAAKKDDLVSLRTMVVGHDLFKVELDSLKERANKGRADLDGLSKENKEQNATVKAMQSTVDGLKEKLTAMSIEHKTLKDETTKVRQDVDKNQSADHERKERRDAQYKAYEETIKDLGKSITEIREKVARLEGAATPSKPAVEPTKKTN